MICVCVCVVQGLSAEEALLFLETQLHQPAVGELSSPHEGFFTSHMGVSHFAPAEEITPVAPSLSLGDEMDVEQEELEAMISVAEQMTADLQQIQLAGEPPPAILPEVSIGLAQETASIEGIVKEQNTAMTEPIWVHK